MALQPHTRLGSYEIVAPLGEGGMGEVYRASDTRLGRAVAIKVLPAHLSSRPDLRERFEREAKTVSSLNHPHICSLFDIGREGNVDFMVLELVEGETLESRLSKGPLPIDLAIRYATEIADALDCAHRAGITHRDLKPGNIMVTKSGTKLLDFGLAKQNPFAGNSSDTPTIARSNLTAEGTIIGTLQYMAPEQLEGVEADARTDVFAFGAIVYEMVTGRKAFQGKSQPSLISAIMSADPPAMTITQPVTPRTLDRIVKNCLAKDPADRWQTMHDVLLQLRQIGDAVDDTPATKPVRNARREYSSWFAIGILLLVVLGVAGVAWRLKRSLDAATGTASLLLSVQPPPGSELDDSVIAPDGKHLVLRATGKDNRSSLWVRAIDSAKLEQLADTEGAHDAFWSPDSLSIGFFADGKLKRVEAAGGPVQILCDAGTGMGGSWNRDVVIFGINSTGLRRVSSNGGEVSVLTVPDPASKEVFHYDPKFLPDGRHFMYSAYVLGQPRVTKIGSLDSKETHVLIPNSVLGTYAAPGYVLFERGPTLMAQPFDLDRLQLFGVPETIATQVSDFSVSMTGLLSLQDASQLEKNELALLDRSGKVLGRVGPPGQYGNPAILPDGTKVAYGKREGTTTDVWVVDLDRKTPTRLTSATSEADAPVWSPDGKQIAFASNESGNFAVYRKSASGEGKEELLFQDPERAVGPESWSSKNGGWLVIGAQGHSTAIDVLLLLLKDLSKPVPFLSTAANESDGQFSPDGRFVAYQSDESGKFQVYVRPSDSADASKWPISADGGDGPHWRGDGKELFYLDVAGLMAVDIVKDGAAIKPGIPHLLFNVRPLNLTGWNDFKYDVTADGKRFIFCRQLDSASLISNILVNWTSLLKR